MGTAGKGWFKYLVAILFWISLTIYQHVETMNTEIIYEEIETDQTSYNTWNSVRTRLLYLTIVS